MTEKQLHFAEEIIRLINKNGGYQEFDIFSEYIDEGKYKTDDYPMDYQFALDLLIRERIIEDWGGHKTNYREITDLKPIVNIGLEQYLKNRNNYGNKLQSFNAKNIVVNSGQASQGNIQNYSSSQKNATYNATHRHPTKIGKILIAILIGLGTSLVAGYFLPEIKAFLNL